MATSTTLTIQGYRDEPVPNRFLRPDGAIDQLAVLLPGFGYTLDMPLFYYAQNLLLERGWDVLRVEYAYNTHPEFQTLPEMERCAQEHPVRIAGCRGRVTCLAGRGAKGWRPPRI